MTALRYFIATLVTVVWAATYLGAILYPKEIRVAPELSLPMLFVLVWVLGPEVREGVRAFLSKTNG